MPNVEQIKKSILLDNIATNILKKIDDAILEVSNHEFEQYILYLELHHVLLDKILDYTLSRVLKEDMVLEAKRIVFNVLEKVLE